MPIGGSGLGEAIPRLHRFAELAGRDPAELAVIPFGTIASPAKLEHYASLGLDEVVLRGGARIQLTKCWPNSTPWLRWLTLRPHCGPNREKEGSGGRQFRSPRQHDAVAQNRQRRRPRRRTQPISGRCGYRRDSGARAPRSSDAASDRCVTPAAVTTRSAWDEGAQGGLLGLRGPRLHATSDTSRRSVSTETR